LDILQHLARFADHPYSSHLVQLLDHFECVGPDGRHICLVLELSWQDFGSFSQGYESELDNRLRLIKKITKQLIQALEYMNVSRIIHHGISFVPLH
jgi:serine/threonine-protein kinase SRPK3